MAQTALPKFLAKIRIYKKYSWQHCVLNMLLTRTLVVFFLINKYYYNNCAMVPSTKKKKQKKETKK